MKKSNYALYSLNIIAVFVYVIIFFNLKTTVSEEIMFSQNSDAKTYKEVANWLAYNLDSESVSIRPFLYPLLLTITRSLGGVYGVWIAQSIFWLLTINFTFLTINRLTKSNLFSFLGAFLILSNLSLIALTLHALTEVTTAFLLSMMLFLLARKIENYSSLRFFHTGLFFIVLLTVLKPVFYIPFLAIFFIILPIFYLKKYLKSPLNSLKLLLIISPLILQISIMKVKYGQVTVSLIGKKTLARYLVPQGIERIEAISFENARKKSENFSQKQQVDYIKNNVATYLGLFMDNIVNNIKGQPTFLLFPKGYETRSFAKFMQNYNGILITLHIIFSLLIFPLIFALFKQKKFSILIFLGFPFILEFYYLFVTGIAFWQGDRLTLPAIVIWSCIYPIILFYYINNVLAKKKKA